MAIQSRFPAALGVQPAVVIGTTASGNNSTVAERLDPSSTGIGPVPWARGRIVSISRQGSYDAVAVNAGARIDRDTMAKIFDTWRPRYCIVVNAAMGISGQAEIGERLRDARIGMLSVQAVARTAGEKPPPRRSRDEERVRRLSPIDDTMGRYRKRGRWVKLV